MTRIVLCYSPVVVCFTPLKVQTKAEDQALLVLVLVRVLVCILFSTPELCLPPSDADGSTFSLSSRLSAVELELELELEPTGTGRPRLIRLFGAGVPLTFPTFNFLNLLTFLT
jgi:hypothetical protein